MDKVTFVAVNPTRNKDIPERLKHRVIREWEQDTLQSLASRPRL